MIDKLLILHATQARYPEPARACVHPSCAKLDSSRNAERYPAILKKPQAPVSVQAECAEQLLLRLK